MSDKTKTFSTRIKSKRDTSANWESANPVLLNGEKIIVDTAAGEVREKIGDGVKTYSQLPFTDEKIRGLITEKADEVELERLKYYGDKDIVPSDASYFTVNSTGETITGLTDTGKTQTELVIPYEINGKKITTLFSGSNTGQSVSILNGNSRITKVIVPKSITTLGIGAFYSCSSLESIDIPDSVMSIENYAFRECTSLNSITIPNSVTSIGDGAFKACFVLKSIDIPDSVTSIGDNAFQQCVSLNSITIPNSVTSIGDGAFYLCVALTKIDIPNSVTSIGNNVFAGHSSNFTIYCEQGSYAETFAKGKNIPIVYTDINAEVIDNKADKSTTLSGYGITDAYTKGEIDSKISTVYKIKGSSTIANLPTNPEVGDVYNITDSGTIVGTEIMVSAGDNIVYTDDGWDKLSATVDLSSYTKEEELERLKYYVDKDIIPSDASYFTVNSTGETITGLTDTGKTQTELVIPYEINGKKITTLYSGSDGSGPPVSILSGNSTITKVVIPKSVTTLGAFAFDRCSSLTSINIPNSVTSIETGTFYGCSSLTSINIPNSVTSIGNVTFYGCSALTKVNIPNSVTSIGNDAFRGCTNLKIYCEQGSYADTYAKDNNIPVVYTAVNNVASGKVTNITVPTTGWTTATDSTGETYFTINITNSALTSTGYPLCDVVLPDDIAAARLQDEAYKCIGKITINDGSVTLCCFDEIPSVSFTMRIQIMYI